jgi:hypothetical protein
MSLKTFSVSNAVPGSYGPRIHIDADVELPPSLEATIARLSLYGNSSSQPEFRRMYEFPVEDSQWSMRINFAKAKELLLNAGYVEV